MHTSPSRALPEDGDVARISPKLCNVLLNPAQSHHLVLQAVVTGNYCVSSTQEAYMTVTNVVWLHSYQNVVIWLRLNRLAHLYFLVRQQIQKLAIKLDLVHWYVSSVKTIQSTLIRPSQSITKPHDVWNPHSQFIKFLQRDSSYKEGTLCHTKM